MRKTRSILLLLFIFPLFVGAQTLDDKLKEIDDYAVKVLDTWKGPGMAIAIVKDDKTVFAKGYGIKKLELSPSLTYARLFRAVKNRDIKAIKALMSRKSLEFGEMAAARNNKEIDTMFENGFTATTFSETLPPMRDERIAGTFGALEVLNEKEEKEKEEIRNAGVGYGEASGNETAKITREVLNAARSARLSKSSWEDLPFVFEDGDWKLAIGELFAGTYKSPGKSFSSLKKDNASTESASQKNPGKKRTKAVPARIISKPALIESPFVDENTIFEIASNTKAFTTASLAILVDEKKLNWDDKVSKYLPEFQMYDPWVTSELTIRDLVSHRVGLATFSGDMLWFNTTYNMDELLRRARYLKPTSSFRTRYGYQNLMFTAAGKIIEKVSGKSWNDFVKERLMDSIGMTRSRTRREELTDNVARAHNTSGGTLRVLPLNNGAGYQAGYGAVGVNASVADLSRWIRLQLGRGTFEGKKIFSPEQSWQMWQPNIMIPIGENSAKNNPTRHFYSYGLGWFLYDYHGRKILNHSGGLDGMLSYTVLIPEENTGFVVLTNNEGPGFAIMMNKILDVMIGAPKRDFIAEGLARDEANKKAEAEEIAKIDATRLPNTKPSLPLASYAGTYNSQMYGDVTVAEENGKLVMRMVPMPSYVADLEHWHLDTWQIKWRPSVGYNFPRGFVTFVIDKDGKSEQLKIDQPNNDLWFYELELKRTK